MMHELGLRILIRKIQLQAIQFDKALTPILAYHKDHYFRIYFKSQNGKTKCDNLLKQHQYVLYNPKTTEHQTSKQNFKKNWQTIGPLWTGKLKDQKLLNTMIKNNPFLEENKFLHLLQKEKDLLGYYDYHVLGKKYKIDLPKKAILLQKIKATPTHFSPTGFKTTKTIKQILKLLQ